jgi:DNA-binding transcriptional regulator LsrR (DeoR family)
LYYEKNLTQSEIAKKFNLSRMKVQRLLIEAKNKQIVQVEITHPFYNLLSIENKLKEIYGLDDAVVVPTDAKGNNLRKDLAKEAAIYLEHLLPRVQVLGVGMGVTLSYLPDFLSPNIKTKKDLKIISLLGNLLPDISANPYTIGNKIAEKLHAPFFSLWAPAKVDSIEEARAFKSQKWISLVLEMIKEVEYSMVGIGVLSKNNLMIRHKFLNEYEYSELSSKAVVGNILGRWYDATGKMVSEEISKKVIATDVKIKGKTIAVAGGPEKYNAILASLKGKLVDILITDEKIARDLIKEGKGR